MPHTSPPFSTTAAMPGAAAISDAQAAPLGEPEVGELIHWTEADGTERSARWRSERGAPAPKRVQLVDDTLTADAAYRLACAGTSMLWRGDFQNARQLLQAMARRIDKTPARKQRQAPVAEASPKDAFHQHRLAQSQRARVLSSLLIPFNADHSIPLRRAPDARAACTEAWGEREGGGDGQACVASLRDLLGMTSAHEWRKKGVEIPALGPAPHNRIHPHYGVFSPVRGEYVQLVADAPLPVQGDFVAFDIGTGTGVLAAVLASRGVARTYASDNDPRALTCARANMARLRITDQVHIVQADLFPPGRATLIVCNPPWLPARASAPIERAVYDENSQMLLGFLNGLAAHLEVGGEGWLILSDLAEHLQLRSRSELLSAIEAAGLVVRGRIDTRPLHPKAFDVNDTLHAARAAEVTSLWRLSAAH